MKKILFVLMAVLLCIGLTACGEEPKAEEKKEVKLKLEKSFITTDKEGVATIIGATNPKAILKIDGAKAEVKKNGDFEYKYELYGNDEHHVDVEVAQKGYKENYASVTIKSGKVYTKLEVPLASTTDSSGIPTIEGATQPGTRLVIEDTEMFADSKGHFSYKAAPLSVDEQSKEIKILAKKDGYAQASQTVTVSNKSTTYLEKDAKEQQERKKARAEQAAREKDAIAKEKVPIASQNTVYGVLDTTGLTKENDELYKDESNDILYSVVENNNIFQVIIGLGEDSTFDKNKDNSHLMELAMDYMNNDASLVQALSDESFIYNSPSLNKKYQVDFSLGLNQNVVGIYVTQYEK